MVNVALIGHPNVGKSLIFTRFTGVGVISSNYGGTTVEFREGTVVRNGTRVCIHDLPGTYSLAGNSEDELVAVQMLAEDRPDCVVLVADATRLEQSLVLLFEVLELGYRTVVALNFMDLARQRSEVDVACLEASLGVRVVPTVARTGEGIDRLADLLASDETVPSDFFVHYDSHIESFIHEVKRSVARTDIGHPARGAVIKLLEGNPLFTERFPDHVLERAGAMRREFEEEHGESMDVHIGRDRYGEAHTITRRCVVGLKRKLSRSERLSDITLRPATGLPILMVVLCGVFLSIIYLGGLLDTVIMDIYSQLVGDAIPAFGHRIGGEFGEAAMRGVDLSIQAILSLVIPYILVFYLMLGMLEDSGYLPRMVVLLDGVMHRMGLHGGAIIPMIVGLGCNVPGILATRAVGSHRERLILGTLIVMAVPCSAQSAIIIGTVGNFVGIGHALIIYLVLFVLLVMIGRMMHKWMVFEPTTLAIDIPELSIPQVSNVASKTWLRIKEFFLIAFPLLLVGSVIIELMLFYDVLMPLVEPMSWFTVGLLGLPAVTILAFIFGVLRKEMALGLLVILLGATHIEELATLLTPSQFFVFALVMATYMPCLATMAVMVKEYGTRDTLVVSVCSITLAALLGILANMLLSI